MPAPHSTAAVSRPSFVFIVGAVGSGNTLMFLSMIQDGSVYGINEDAFGSTLVRLLRSEREMHACPHSLVAFVRFLEALRGDRSTLVLKTPSNLRQFGDIRSHLPGSSFICMVREPHAAVASGLARHAQPVSNVADLWMQDMEHVLEQADNHVVVIPFERLVTQPRLALETVTENVLELSPKVADYADRMADPRRASDSWWESRVNADVRKRIREEVRARDLQKLHRELLALAPAPLRDITRTGRGAHPARRLRRLLFRAWYRRP